MNKRSNIILVVSLVFVLGAGAGYLLPRLAGKAHKAGMTAGKGQTKQAKAEKEQELYTCPMHPFIITEEPGACPICGMTLVTVKDGGSDMGSDENSIRIDPVVRQNMGVRTGTALIGPLGKLVRTVGVVTYDETNISSVNTKIAGWIEKLFIDETGQFVKAGEPILEIYSPELVSAQKELLIALRHFDDVKRSPYKDVVEGAKALLEATKERLRLWDITEGELENLLETGEVRKTLTIFSPTAGVVVKKNAFLGTHVKPGAELYRVADISRVWVDADIYEFELPWIKEGQTAKVMLDYIPDRAFDGEVSYIYPYLEKKTKTVKVRIDIPNEDFTLKPDMFAHVEIKSQISNKALLIPSEAVIRTGVRNVVFVEKKEGEFVPREVRLGVETGNGSVQVTDGLEPGEKIVLSGQFMLDSESSIREAIRKMTSGGSEGASKGMEHMGH